MVEYPYNDLKNEINFRRLDGGRFSEDQLIKILKAGICSLYELKKADYRQTFTLNQFSICFFSKPDSDLFRVKILEFDINNFKYLPSNNLEESLRENCKQLALIIIEAGLLLNEMLVYQNFSDLVILRYFDDF